MGIPADQRPIAEFELPPTLLISLSNRETESVFKARAMPLVDALLKLMDHGVGGKKGSCFSPFQFQNDRRSSENALSCQLGVIDCDRGDTSSDIASACSRHGFAALIVSTHSSGATSLEVKKVEWDRFKEKHPEGSAEQFLQMRQYRQCVWEGAKVAGSIDGPEIENTAFGAGTYNPTRPLPEVSCNYYCKEALGRGVSFPAARMQRKCIR